MIAGSVSVPPLDPFLTITLILNLHPVRFFFISKKWCRESVLKDGKKCISPDCSQQSLQ